MDLTSKTVCIISCGVGGWYGVGVERLEKSLVHHGYAGGTIFYKNEYPPLSPRHEENPYAFKIALFREAIARGYKNILWADSSFWNIRNCHSLFDIINDHGVFAFRSGYNCAQTCSDHLLEYVGITRDEAERLPEIATGAVGINIDNPDGKAVFEYWAELCDRGLFKNSRVYDKVDSQDPRFLFGRQDQSAFSMAVHKRGLELEYVDYVAYYNSGNPGYNPEKCLFFIGGL
jgi:hypothetical protein